MVRVLWGRCAWKGSSCCADTSKEARLRGEIYARCICDVMLSTGPLKKKNPKIQWVPRDKNTRVKSIRDLREVKSACPAYSKNYVLPTTTDKSVVQLRAPILACHGALIPRGTHCKCNPCRCLLYTSPSPRDLSTSRMPSSA